MQLIYECTCFPSHYVFPRYLLLLSLLQDDFESSHFNFFKHSKVLLQQINEYSLKPSLRNLLFIQFTFHSVSLPFIQLL